MKASIIVFIFTSILLYLIFAFIFWKWDYINFDLSTYCWFGRSNILLGLILKCYIDYIIISHFREN
jgi:hypothetical protein